VFDATITATDIVFNCPIIATGRLTQPPLPPPPGSYRIPQVLAFSNYSDGTSPPKSVRLPRYTVWFPNPITTKTWTAHMPITDASNAALAALLKANLAPGLLNVPLDDTQAFWWFNSPYPSLCQRPIMSAGPSTSAAAPHGQLPDINVFLDYSPVMVYTLLNRNIPQYVTVGSVRFLDALLISGGLTIASDTGRINGHASFVTDYRVP
jgi:hypothetical protein